MKSRPSGVVFSLKLAVYVALIAHGMMFALSTLVILKIVGILLIGAMYAHGVELQHQALHYQGFRSKRLNMVFGVLLGMPMLVSFHAYQDSHLRHHRLLGTPENKEFFDYGDQYGARPSSTSGCGCGGCRWPRTISSSRRTSRSSSCRARASATMRSCRARSAATTY
ncbi:fatty acid desaturase [Burkholderia cenocepacia]|uniref:fatty acid desaturase n=1 Tax=Burkholderia cenocepacia TaxID=95486 RepID=UPI0022391573|nr:fatty acid desaturase [Burkholderia cenocepacia]